MTCDEVFKVVFKNILFVIDLHGNSGPRSVFVGESTRLRTAINSGNNGFHNRKAQLTNPYIDIVVKVCLYCTVHMEIAPNLGTSKTCSRNRFNIRNGK